MPLRRLAVFGLAFFSQFALPASEFIADARYLVLRNRPNELVETLGISTVEDHGSLTLATRMTHAAFQFNAFEVALLATYSPLSWIKLHSRILHRNRLFDVSSTTAYFGSVRLTGHFPSFLSYFLEMGLVHRRTTVGANSIVPVLFGPSFVDWDLTANLGIGIHFPNAWVFKVSLETSEWFDLYNFNNPYVQVSGQFPLSFATLTAYARYHALLGFGIYESWTTGLQLTFPGL
jgi:hypothetical protein